jgi:hypothetical protein
MTMTSWRSSPERATLLALALVFGLLFAALLRATPALAEPVAQPHLSLETRVAPTNLPLAKLGAKGEVVPAEGLIVINVTNLGDAEFDGAAGNALTVTDALPAGVTATSVRFVPDDNGPGQGDGNEEQKQKIIEREHAFPCPRESGAEIECTFDGKLPPYEQMRLEIFVSVSATSPDEPENLVTIGGEGSKQASAPVQRPLKINGKPTTFGVESYEMSSENDDFGTDSEAGTHPFQLTTVFNLNQSYEEEDVGGKFVRRPEAPALEKNLSFKLPPGLLGDVNAVPECSDESFGAEESSGVDECPNSTAVGVATVSFNDVGGLTPLYTWVVPVFNLVPSEGGEPAQFGFSIDHVPVVLDTSVRTGEDYGVTVSVKYASDTVQILGSAVTFWGMPGDKIHNASRGWSCLGYGGSEYRKTEPCNGHYDEAVTPTPFLTLPTKCEPLSGPVEGEAWNPGGAGESTPLGGIALRGNGEIPSKTSSGLAEIPNENAANLTGCGALAFEPTMSVKAETEDASTPTGLNVNVTVPQGPTLEASYEGKAEADVSETKLELPLGIQANPGAANGLATCGIGEAGFLGKVNQETNVPAHSSEELAEQSGEALGSELGEQGFTALPASCLEAAKIGSVDIHTPDLKEDLVGGVYLGSQDTNPFGSPLVLYIIAEEPTSKVLVKLAGEVSINQETGQLTSDFKNTPQDPFESLTLHLTNGGRASQASPAKCGSYPARATFASSSKAPSETHTSESTISITSGPEGTPCPAEGALPFSASTQAGPTTTQAAADTPFVVNIGRPDGDQAIESINMKLPPGAAALISQVTPCAEAVAEADQCPESSQVGTTKSFSGLGGDPVVLEGKLYLTGELTANAEHGSGPFGLEAVTLAHAGPFELGDVNVFSTINVNPVTSAATVTSGRIPQMLKGVPTQLKALSITVERPGGAPFQFNPTNCGEELKIEGTLSAYEGGSSPIDDHYPVTGCSSLPFAPKLKAVVGAQGSKANGTSFDVTIESPGLGQANIHKVDLTLPEALPSRLETIQKACPEQTFYANPANCDEGSVIGEGIVHTPVFNNPLMGPAYLVSHAGAAFPDVDFVLQGEGITLVVTGKTDIKNGITYSKFETSPDAPFTKFESIFPTGPHSALTANTKLAPTYNLCKLALTMPTEITGQNGAFISETTKIGESGCAGVLPSKAHKLSRAQHLAKALKSCRSKYKKKKSKRVTCEKQARKKYGPKAKKKSSKKSKKS